MKRILVLGLFVLPFLISSFKNPKAAIEPFGNAKSINKKTPAHKGTGMLPFNNAYAFGSKSNNQQQMVYCNDPHTYVWFYIDPENPWVINYDMPVGSCENPCDRCEMLMDAFPGYYFGWSTSHGPYGTHPCEVAAVYYPSPTGWVDVFIFTDLPNY